MTDLEALELEIARARKDMAAMREEMRELMVELRKPKTRAPADLTTRTAASKPTINPSRLVKWAGETPLEKLAASVACPTCQAPARHHCVRADGFKTDRGVYHIERLRAARRAGGAR